MLTWPMHTSIIVVQLLAVDSHFSDILSLTLAFCILISPTILNAVAEMEPTFTPLHIYVARDQARM